jgi:ADP-heptose:LPS heptosyltransferase
MGAIIAPYIPFIDDTIVSELPWSKNEGYMLSHEYTALVEEIKQRKFDAAIIFTVYSQSALPAALTAWLSGIPVRAAYCRENPYALLTHWMPDKEPYDFIKHQVQRDLDLVALLGAGTSDDRLSVTHAPDLFRIVSGKLQALSIDAAQPYILFHAPVSEAKREYPAKNWIKAGKLIRETLRLPILLTGTEKDARLTSCIANGIGDGAYSIAGMFNVGELISLISQARLLVSVNTGNVHIAAATNTPVVVLYALTNPQHTPWKVDHRILYYSIPENIQSKNEVIRYVSQSLFKNYLPVVMPHQVADAAAELLKASLPVSI